MTRSTLSTFLKLVANNDWTTVRPGSTWIRLGVMDNMAGMILGSGICSIGLATAGASSVTGSWASGPSEIGGGGFSSILP